MADNYNGIEKMGIRHWGKRKEPMTFNIVVNDMKDILKHRPIGPVRTDISLSSSLDGGSLRIGGYYG